MLAPGHTRDAQHLFQDIASRCSSARPGTRCTSCRGCGCAGAAPTSDAQQRFQSLPVVPFMLYSAPLTTTHWQQSAWRVVRPQSLDQGPGACAHPQSRHRCAAAVQVDYAQAALFLNISAHVSGSAEAQVAWWQHSELRMKAGLDPRTQARPPCAAPLSTCLTCCVCGVSLQSPASELPPGWHYICQCASAAHLIFMSWPPGLTSLQGCTQDVDRYSPAWWYADVPETAIIPLRKLEAVLPYLRQVNMVLDICDMLLALPPASPLAASDATELYASR